jgi:hypothetical protein
VNRVLPVTLAIVALATACNPASNTEASLQSPTAVDPSAPLPTTQPAVTPQAAASLDFIEAPLETSSPTGATVRLDQFETGTDCLRLSLQVMGIKGPPNAPSDFEPPAPITDIALFEPGSDVALDLAPMGGGGGGAPAFDGTFIIGTERIYRLDSSLPHRPLQLLVKLSMDESLGFVEPVSFPAQTSVGPSLDCGLQGSTSP